MNEFENMSADELLAVAEQNQDNGATVVIDLGQPPQEQPQQVQEVGQRPLPTVEPVKSHGRPRFDDPTNPQHLWAIANRKGVEIFLWCDALQDWVSQSKLKIKPVLRDIKVSKVRAELRDAGNGRQMLLIG